MRRLTTNANGSLAEQVFAAMKTEPLEVLRYAWRTAAIVVAFIAHGPGPSVLWRLKLLLRFIYVHLRVPGGVTLPETLFLVEGVCNAPSDGALVEVGSWKGLSAVCLSLVSGARGQKLFAVDTFAGLPQTEGPLHVAANPSRSYVFEKGAYFGSQDDFWSNMRRFGRPASVSTVQGDVCEMSALALPEGTTVGYAFIDVDLPTSYRGVFRVLAPYVGVGTRIHLHEGLLEPVLRLVQDPSFWKQLGLTSPSIEILQETKRLRTLLVELKFSGGGGGKHSA